MRKAIAKGANRFFLNILRANWTMFIALNVIRVSLFFLKQNSPRKSNDLQGEKVVSQILQILH